MNWLNIDPDLPTLPFAFDESTITQRFEQDWPARRPAACPRTSVKLGRRQDVQYIPATRCVTTYPLAVEHGESAPWPTIGVVEATKSGLKHRLFTDDSQLPGLIIATHSAAMRERFAALNEDGEQAEVVQSCAVTPIRYKPASRCTLRYDLQTAQGLKSCYGKLQARNRAQEKGSAAAPTAAALWHTISTLYRASQQEPELPRISQPLTYWPEMEMVVQSAVTGAELHTAAFDPGIAAVTRLAWLRTAGRCCAALHSCTGVEGSQRSLADDLADLPKHYPVLLQANAGLADRFEEAIAALGLIAQTQTELTAVLSHGALRTDQFMLEDGQLVLIDLDSVCWASPARDLGNFLAYLTWKALRQPQHATFIRGAQQAFLAGYAELRTLPEVGWLAAYQAASLLKIIGRRYSGLTYQEWPLTEQLLEIALRMLPVIGQSSSNQ